MQESVNLLSPNFYVVASHGTGLQSFLYYLRLLQLPSTYWWGQREEFFLLRKNYKFCGFTLDCRLERGEVEPFHEYLQAGSAPVFWLVRDPVDLLISCVNQRIGDAIINGIINNTLEESCKNCTLLRNDFSTYKNVLSGKYYFPYQSLLRRVCNFRFAKIIDATDLRDDKILQTMTSVYWSVCGYKPENVDNLYSKMVIPYNQFNNRVWSSMPFVPINIGKIVFYVKIFPKNIGDFHLQHEKFMSVDFFDGEEQYCVYFEDKIVRNNLHDICNVSRAQLNEYFCVFKNIIDIAAEKFGELKVSSDLFFDILLKNKKELCDFVNTQSTTIKYMSKIDCDYKHRWDNFERLVSKIN